MDDSEEGKIRMLRIFLLTDSVRVLDNQAK